MAGISDVRLSLYGRELLDGQKTTVRSRGLEGLSLLGLFRQRQSTRRALLALTEEQLRDIGLTYEQARHEGLKPFWRE
ncbi:DUF1127 domain-containing protein [Pseudomonas sp. GD03842]|uniref:DUF1127 domain-containing protein n=1 Tax=Pseudomonas sp. GD03842 TaxID=2975385 RepID=UPI00244AD070|nr:DUF1127 domain-containing protein [Pseudomonas sp. GD03842]MDH0745928.1 DUF1127 domain-containing protein [Pseudomonas sp. GD03842]